MTTTAETGTGHDERLRRVISRPMLAFFILGAGIYSLTGEVGGEVGGAIWLACITMPNSGPDRLDRP